MKTVIETAHTLMALIIAVTSLITALTVLLRKINEFLKGYRELVNLIKEGGKPKMTKPITIFFIVTVCLFIGLGILGIRGFTEPIPTLRAPFDMTLYFYPSGWMGDGELGTRHVQLNTGFCECQRTGDTDGICIKISYQPGPRGWAAIYWQYPDSNWGGQPGRRIVGATRIAFWAKGEIGGEIVEFKAGGISAHNKPYRDSFEVSRGRINLTTYWTRYEITLSGEDLSHVIGAFAWVASRDANPDGLMFYIDDIRYE